MDVSFGSKVRPRTFTGAINNQVSCIYVQYCSFVLGPVLSDCSRRVWSHLVEPVYC